MSIFVGAHKKAYFVEETVYGTTPANPTMREVGFTEKIGFLDDESRIKIRGASRYLAAIKQGLRKITLTIPFTTYENNFIKYITTLNSVSLEIVYEDENNNILSFMCKGAKMDELSLDVMTGQELRFNASLFPNNVVPDSGLQGQTYQDASGDAWDFSDCLVEYGYVLPDTECPNVHGFSLNVKNHLRRVPTIRSSSANIAKYMPHRHCDLTGSLLLLLDDEDWIDQLLLSGQTNKQWKFSFGSSYIRLSGVELDALGLEDGPEDVSIQRIPFTARAIITSW